MANFDATVLVIDDEREHADVLAEALEKVCSNTMAVYTGADAMEIIKNRDIDVVVTDLNLGGDINGLDVLNQAKEYNPVTEIILITAYATIDTCKEAIRCGAYDYLVKPVEIDQLRDMVAHACGKSKSAVKSGANSLDEFKFDGVIGQSAAIGSIFSILRRVSPTDITVLIEGESGTGKELLAQAIHNNSSRWNNAFRPINCAGLTETLLESELFGHTKGAFTGAAEARKGLFEVADKGTLFLDEIGDMPLVMQAKLLRVLEDGIVVPVGSTKPIKVDVRIISATNHDLAKLVEEKKFRQDLYFRIKGVSVTIPPLRDRKEDISGLAGFFLAEAKKEIGRKVTGFTESAMEILKNCDWPGNVRQLKNCIRTMVVMSEGTVLDVHDILPEIHQVRQLTPIGGKAGDATLNDLEKQAIVNTLVKVNNNREKAAKILGIGERTLYRKIKEYDL
jgi:DNA-binding NtrC family response regulator